MTEEEWLNATDPRPMLKFLRDAGLVMKDAWAASDRKRWLLACACLRRNYFPLTNGWIRQAVEATERMVDGQESEERWLAVLRLRREDLSRRERWRVKRCTLILFAASVAPPGLFRDIFGDPFHPTHFIDPELLAWNEGLVGRLAEAVYEERAMPEGTLDRARLAVLADALEEAGCADTELLGHLRGPCPHVRGCWALDVVLGKG
jgi:hypothetical protein